VNLWIETVDHPSSEMSC